MKKGFTLIELLAVIVILAIVALVATPIVLNVVEESRKSAAESSVLMYVDGVKLSYSEEMLNPSGKTLKELTDEKMSGEKVTCEVVEYSKTLGVILKNCTVGDYGVRYSYLNGLIEEDTPEEIVLTGKAVCARKTSVTDGVLATLENPYVAGGEYICNMGDDVLRTFFVLEDGTDTVSLIMNENIGSNVAWISEEDYKVANDNANDGFSCSDTSDGVTIQLPSCLNYGPITAINYLNSLTSGWNDVEVSLPNKEVISNFEVDYKYPEWLYSNLNIYNEFDDKYTNVAYHVYFVDNDTDGLRFPVELAVMSMQLDACIPVSVDGTIMGCAIPTPEDDHMVGVRPVITISKTLMK